MNNHGSSLKIWSANATADTQFIQYGSNQYGLPPDWNVTAFTGIFKPTTKSELQTAVDLWCSDRDEGVFQYGEINTWNTILITDMEQLFKDKTSFNDSINNWNVSNVTSMMQMFYDATNFNQSLNSWNTGNVLDMTCMFCDATNFNGNISSWNVSSVTLMESMFMNASQF